MPKTTKTTKKTPEKAPKKVQKERVERETIRGMEFCKIYKGDKLIKVLTAQEFEIQESE